LTSAAAPAVIWVGPLRADAGAAGGLLARNVGGLLARSVGGLLAGAAGGLLARNVGCLLCGPLAAVFGAL
jgi:hypothetical protein